LPFWSSAAPIIRDSGIIRPSIWLNLQTGVISDITGLGDAMMFIWATLRSMLVSHYRHIKASVPHVRLPDEASGSFTPSHITKSGLTATSLFSFFPMCWVQSPDNTASSLKTNAPYFSHFLRCSFTLAPLPSSTPPTLNFMGQKHPTCVNGRLQNNSRNSSSECAACPYSSTTSNRINVPYIVLPTPVQPKCSFKCHTSAITVVKMAKSR